MAQPTPYVPSFDFSDWSTLNPDIPQPGVNLDAQFNAIKLTTNQTLANLALIQRDDGQLANGIVTPDSLSEELRAGISRAIPWATATAYNPGDLVWYLSKLYSVNAGFTGNSTTNPAVDTTRYTLILDMTATVPDIITQDAQDAADAAMAAQVAAEAAADSVSDLVASVTYLWAGQSAGTANTIILAPQPDMTSYTVGHKLRFLVGTTNTSAVSMDTDNGLGPRTIKKNIGGSLVSLVAGDLKAATIAEIEYISDIAGYQLMNPSFNSKGADIASGGTINLDTATGDYVTITGTTGITAITLSEGRARAITFSGALLLTHSASLLLKNNGANITTVAGDSAVFRGEAGGVVRMISYNRASGVATNLQVAPRFLSGLEGSTAGASTTITISAGQAADSTAVDYIALASALAKTTANWAAGTAAGGLDTGTIANTTWYTFYSIKNPTTGATDVTYSTNTTTPALQAGWTLYRRIFSWRTNGSGQWENIEQEGDDFLWKTPVASVNQPAPGTSAQTVTMATPLGVKTEASLQIIHHNTGGVSSGQIAVTSLYADATTPSTSYNDVANSGAGAGSNLYAGGNKTVRTNTSAQVRYQVSYSDANVVVKINTLGWRDRRGK